MIPAVLSLAAAALAATIPLQLHLDTRRAWAEAWQPEPVSPPPRSAASGLPRRHRPTTTGPAVTEDDQPATELVERLLAGLRDWNGGRPHLGEAAGTCAQQARWNTPTGQFWAIVDFNALDEPCSHCAAPEDGEPPHAGCPGCACPCGTAEPLPDGVDGYTIAGRTR